MMRPVNAVLYGLRRLLRSPGLTAGVILSFALGIGANAVMFEVVDRLLLSPPAHIADAGRVKRLMIHRISPETKLRTTTDVLSYPDYVDLERARGFAEVAAVSHRTLTVGHGVAARRYHAQLVSGSFFPLLRVNPELGRFFGPPDDKPGAPGVAVISYGAWQGDFGGDPHVIGRTIDFGHGPYVIAGVAPAGFTGVDLDRVDVWLPIRVATAQMWSKWQWLDNRNMNWLRVIGRLAPGVSVQTADAEATLLHRQGRSDQVRAGQYDASARVLATPLIAARGPLASPESKVTKWLAGISLLVLLIACANVANLLLARAVRQRREMAIRLALGSSRARVIGHALTESLILAGLGAIAALLLTQIGGRVLRSYLLPDIVWSEPHLMSHVLAFVVIVAVLAGLVSGVIPAMEASRVDLVATIKSAASRNASGSTSTARDALTILQIALSVVLLAGAGLFVHSFHRANAVDLGFDPAGVLVISPEFDHDTGTADAVRDAEFTRRALARLGTLPGVERVSTDLSTPFESEISTKVEVPGLDSLPILPSGPPIVHTISPDYFSLMHLSVIRGRGLLARDNHRGAPRVAVVNDLMARTLWPGRNAIGQCLIVHDDDTAATRPPCATVVGVVADAVLGSVSDPAPMQFYIPADAGIMTTSLQDVLVRVRGDATASIPIIRQTVAGMDPSVRYLHVDPMQAGVDLQTHSWKLGATTFSAFGLLALVVAGIGLYSVLAFGVAQRTFEIGIRAALGATPDRLLRMVAGEAARLVGVGVAIGLAVAIAVAPRAQTLLFEVSPYDPVTLVTALVSILLVAAVAAIVPARRAAMLDPVEALRAE